MATLSLINQHLAVLSGTTSLLLSQRVREAANPADRAGELLVTLPDPFAGLGGGATVYATAGVVPPQLSLIGNTVVRGTGPALAGVGYAIGVVSRSGDGRSVYRRLTFMVLGGASAPAPSAAPYMMDFRRASSARYAGAML